MDTLPYVGPPGISSPHPENEFETYASSVLDHSIVATGEAGAAQAECPAVVIRRPAADGAAP